MQAELFPTCQLKECYWCQVSGICKATQSILCHRSYFETKATEIVFRMVCFLAILSFVYLRAFCFAWNGKSFPRWEIILFSVLIFLVSILIFFLLISIICTVILNWWKNYDLIISFPCTCWMISLICCVSSTSWLWNDDSPRLWLSMSAWWLWPFPRKQGRWRDVTCV